MRRAFGLFQALIVIILVSGILVIAMKYATVSIKQTNNIYVKQSAQLFLDSVIEMSLLAISGYDRNTTHNCLEQVSITSADNRFIADVNITKYYLLNGSIDCTYCTTLCEPIKTSESQGMVMLQINVEINATHPKNKGKHIKLTRRTLQRP